MRNFKGHKALTQGTEVEGESWNLGAKCMYASLTPKAFSLLLFVLFLLATLAPFEFPLSKGGDSGLFPWGLGVVDAFAADNGYFTPQEFPTGQAATGNIGIKTAQEILK